MTIWQFIFIIIFLVIIDLRIRYYFDKYGTNKSLQNASYPVFSQAEIEHAAKAVRYYTKNYDKAVDKQIGTDEQQQKAYYASAEDTIRWLVFLEEAERKLRFEMECNIAVLKGVKIETAFVTNAPKFMDYRHPNAEFPDQVEMVKRFNEWKKRYEEQKKKI